MVVTQASLGFVLILVMYKTSLKIKIVSVIFEKQTVSTLVLGIAR